MDQHLPFLDVLVTRNINTITLKPYRKPTATERTITSDSNHPFSQKMAAFHSMAHRLVSLKLSTADFNEERETILRIGEKNGYSRPTVKRIIRKHQRKQLLRDTTMLQPIEQDDESIFGRLCYDEETQKCLQPLLKRMNVRVAYRSSNLKSYLRSPKDSTPTEKKSGIYRVSCQSGCDDKYIGMTKRNIGMRLREHLLHFRNLEPLKSAVANHLINEQHRADQTTIELIRNVNETNRLILWESLEMRKERNLLMNIDPPLQSPLYGLMPR